VPRVAAFEQAHPEISLRLNASTRLVDFSVTTDIDAAIRYGEGRWPGVAAELLVDDVMFPVASPEVASRLRGPRDLARERLFVEDPHWDLWGEWLAAAGLEDLPRNARRLSDDYSVQLEAAVLGQGVALTRGMLAADDLRAGRLVCPFDVAARPRVQYYFVCPPERLAELNIRRTLEWLKGAALDTVAGLEAWYGEVVETRR
jgi:LysR family glycine cleavage system transcriptional activator